MTLKPPREMTKEYSRGLQCKVTHRRKIKPNCSYYITLRSNGGDTEGPDMRCKSNKIFSHHVQNSLLQDTGC